MTGKDAEVYIQLFYKWAEKRKNDKISRILVVNPDPMQESVMKAVFPGSNVVSLSYPTVNLDTGDLHGNYDIVFISNTLMCSGDPGKWIMNALNCSREVWIQELVRAWRESNSELSPLTGDICRFTFPKRNEISRVDGYDLESDNRFLMEDIHFYSDLPGSGDHDCRKFIAAIKKADKTKVQLNDKIK